MMKQKTNGLTFLVIHIFFPAFFFVDIINLSLFVRFKNNGQNFSVPLPKKDKAVTNLPIQQNFSVPEELVQIQAYLRWERKGKQVYSPEKEKASQRYASISIVCVFTNIRNGDL